MKNIRGHLVKNIWALGTLISSLTPKRKKNSLKWSIKEDLLKMAFILDMKRFMTAKVSYSLLQNKPKENNCMI